MATQVREVAFQGGNSYSDDHPFGSCRNSHAVGSVGRYHERVTSWCWILIAALQDQAGSLHGGLHEEIRLGLVRLDEARNVLVGLIESRSLEQSHVGKRQAVRSGWERQTHPSPT